MQLTPGEHLVDTETAVDRFGRLWLVIKCDGETWDRIGPFKSEDELNAADGRAEPADRNSFPPETMRSPRLFPATG